MAHQNVLHLYETIYQGYKQDIFVNLTLYRTPKCTPRIRENVSRLKQRKQCLVRFPPDCPFQRVVDLIHK